MSTPYSIKGTLHPHDPQWRAKRQHLIHKELLPMTPRQINEAFLTTVSKPLSDEEKADARELTKSVLGGMFDTPHLADALARKSILDTTGSGTSGGSVLIRQDLEPFLHALYVQQFPAWERIQHGAANGLTHAFNQMTAPDGNALGSSAISELGTVNYNQTSFSRQTANIAVLATGRGVSFKEQAAVAAGGAPYNPLAQELSNGMTVLARDVQYFMFAGNSTYSSGTGTSEAGNYLVNGFDGLRMITGSVSGTNYSGNNALQSDQGTLNQHQSIKFVASKIADYGGFPDLILETMSAKEALDTELGDKRWYTDNTTEVVAGVTVNRIQAAAGLLDILPVPGTTIGTYTSPTTSQTVEDIYVLDSAKLWLRWLYADNFTVLEIPSGVDSVLSSRYIVFALEGLEVAAPLFTGKVRRVAA
jgi:hypothetical protein